MRAGNSVFPTFPNRGKDLLDGESAASAANFLSQIPKSLCSRFGSLRLGRRPRGNEPGNRTTVAGDDDFLTAFHTVEEF